LDAGVTRALAYPSATQPLKTLGQFLRQTRGDVGRPLWIVGELQKKEIAYGKLSMDA
jgi:hypothetical protein